MCSNYFIVILYNMSESENKPVIPQTDNSVPEKITTDKKPKNPNRVEWGRKLSKLSAAAKKSKKEGKQITTIKETVEEDLNIDKTSNNYLIALTVGGLLIGGAALYYQRKTYIHDTKINESPQTTVVKTENLIDMME